MNGQVSQLMSHYEPEVIFIFFLPYAFLICALIIDAVISTVPDFLQDQIATTPGMILFIITGCAYVAGQYFILQFIKEKTKEIRSKFRYLNFVHRMVTVIQYSLVAIFVFIVLEMLIGWQYHLMNLIAAHGS